MDGDRDDGVPVARRRRRRATRAAGAPATRAPAAAIAAPAEPTAAEPVTAEPLRRRAPRNGGERGMRDLLGTGRSQLGVSGALRARDVNRPSDADLAEAEREVVIVRRHWTPDDHR